MKGATEALSAILITGVLISVVGSVYFWGLPLIQKNKDIATLESSEIFMSDLNKKIKSIANNGGRAEFIIAVPGVVLFDGTSISLTINSQGTQYATDANVPLGKNSCNVNAGIWSRDEPDTLCVLSKELSETSYETTYSIKYIQLDTEISEGVKGPESFKIELTGNPDSGGEGTIILIENLGTEKVTLADDRDLIRTNVSIKLRG